MILNILPPPTHKKNSDTVAVNTVSELLSEKQNAKRYYGIDLLKLILSILVILIHIPPSWESIYYSIYIKPALTRFAVPCFFIISGWFLFGNNSSVRAIKSLKRLIPITLFSSVVFYIINGLPKLYKWDIQNLILYNSTDQFGYHLWYLYAFLYVLIAVAAFNNRIWKIGFYLLPLLLCTELCLGKYSNIVFGRAFPVIYCRNFLVTGFTYVLLGGLLKKFELQLNRKILLVLILFFAFSTIFEKYVLLQLGLEAPRESYISTPCLAIAVFLFFKDLIIGESRLTEIGNKYSLWIYIIHPAILKLFV